METLYSNSANNYYGHGKLLLTGEYFVLDGALALALPTSVGQSMTIKYRASYDPKIYWKSIDCTGRCWFDATYDFWRFRILSEETPEALFLQKVLTQARKQNPHFLRDEMDVFVETKLEFPLEWGLGSSSTLIYNISQWAYISPFELLFKTTGGSGYDIACAQSIGPILYERKNAGPIWKNANFNPSFKENLYFVYLGKKQNSEEAIKFYKQNPNVDKNELSIKLSAITREILVCDTIEEFEFLLASHEKIISNHLSLPRAKDLYFGDFWGEVKSLGAWGGDFVLVTSTKAPTQTREYFNNLGFDVFIPYGEMIKAEIKNSNAIDERPVGELLQ